MECRVLNQSLDLLPDPARYQHKIVTKPDSKEDAADVLEGNAVAFVNYKYQRPIELGVKALTKPI